MKKAILFSIIGVSLLSLAFTATTFAYEYWDTCAPYGCYEPAPFNDNFNWNETINTNINDLFIGGGFGGFYYGDDGYDYDEPQCDDGRDNDGDGRIDYPSDSGCSSYRDDSERSNGNDYDDPECDDNRDNDDDGDYDYPEDEGCRSYSDDSEDSDDNDDERECDDGRDNDRDGDEDYPEDRGCSSRNDDSEDSDDNNNDDEPEVTTRSASDIRETSATLNGRVDGNGLNTRVWFEYSEDRDDVDTDEETGEDSVGSGTTSFDERITGLRRDTTYYFRAVAENADGEDRGSIMSFRTDDDNNYDDDEPECDDNRDNDRDGDEDYPDDRGCSSRNDNSEDSDDRDDDDDRNLPPFYTSTPGTSVVAGQVYSYNADAISPNGRAITYSLTTRPAGMAINQFTGQVLWPTTAGLAGTSHPVRVVAEDSRGNTVTQTYTIVVVGQIINPPIYPPVNPPVTQLRISNVRIDEVNDDVVVSFDTNINARGSVRYGQVSQSDVDDIDDFDYQFSQISENGQGTSHEVNLGSLIPGETYFIRAFGSAGSRNAFSTEFTFTRRVISEPSVLEAAGTVTCEDGIDNDRDGVADAADPDCEVTDQDAVTFASTLESFGAFLISPWFLILVIIVLIIYIIVTRRSEDVVVTHGPIEIKS